MHSPNSKLSRRSSQQNRASCALLNRTVLLRRVHCSANTPARQQQAPGATSADKQQQALEALQQVFTPLEIHQLVSSRPEMLDLPAAAWLEFFEGYGLSKEAMWKMMRCVVWAVHAGESQPVWAGRR
jgi:hypothetical protein